MQFSMSSSITLGACFARHWLIVILKTFKTKVQQRLSEQPNISIINEKLKTKQK